MAPPAHPSGYIPPSFRHEPPPYGMDSNTRAYVIFFGYLGTCAALTLYIISKLSKSYAVLAKSQTARPPPKKYVYLFIALAIGSLGSTWYYMFRFFYASYSNWVMWRAYYDLKPEQMHWGLWLKETSLFKEAWEVALVGYARYWWTNQIFFFACALGLDLERKGIRRGIRHTWTFMLLGQIVAISFATNLFIIAQLLSPPPPPPPSSTGVYKRRWLGPWVLNFGVVIATIVPAYVLAAEEYWYGHAFFNMLITPHVALLVLPIIRSFLPQKYFLDTDVEFSGRIYKFLWILTIGGGVLLGLNMTGAAVRYGGYQGILDAVLEHPAVSSVSFDVIFCWITWTAWSLVKRANANDVFVREKDPDEVTWEASGTTVSIGEGGAVRRR